MTIALKFFSFADLLPKKGDGGVKGDAGGQANAHAGLVVPLASKRASPPPTVSGELGAHLNWRGGTDSQHPWGLQGTDPTDPTDSAYFESSAHPSPDGIDRPINTDPQIKAWLVIDLAHGGGEFKTAMNSDEFYPRFDDVPKLEHPGGDIEPPGVPADPIAWQALAAAYHAHHFGCPTCIAAGRGSRCGQRCGAGMALWRLYCD